MFLILCIFGCDDGSFVHSGDNEQKILGPMPGLSSDSQNPVTLSFQAKYDFKVEFKVLKLALCEGVAEIHSFSDLSSRLVGEIPCIGGQDIDLLNGSDFKSYSAPIEIEKSLPLFGYFDRTASQKNITYDPPITVMIAPIINDINLFSGLLSDEAVTFTKNLGDGTTETSSGRMITKVNSIDSYTPPNYPETFNQVVHWERKFTEFDSEVNFGQYSVYREIEYWIQPRPFVITKVRIVSKLKDLMSSDDSESDGDLASKLGLNVVITLDLKHHESK